MFKPIDYVETTYIYRLNKTKSLKNFRIISLKLP